MKLMSSEKVRSLRVTKPQLADRYGLASYDVALPQSWLESTASSLAAHTGKHRQDCYDWILSTTVWNYPKGNICGEPFYLTKDLHDVATKVDGRVRHCESS
jgi:hypothetical protein